MNYFSYIVIGSSMVEGCRVLLLFYFRNFKNWFIILFLFLGVYIILGKSINVIEDGE